MYLLSVNIDNDSFLNEFSWLRRKSIYTVVKLIE